MLVYYLMFGIVIFLYPLLLKSDSIKKKNDSTVLKCKQYTAIVSMFIILTMGLRSITVGVDLRQYLYRYTESNHFWNDYKWERGYSFIGFVFNDILKQPFQVYLFLVTAFVIIITSLFALNNSTNVMLSLLVYLTIGNFSMNMSGLRQTIAIALMIISIDFIKKQKLIPYIILIITAFSIHTSAICFIPVYFLWGKAISKKKAWILFMITILLIPTRGMILPLIKHFSPERYSGYSLVENYQINWLVILVPIVFCIYFLLYVNVENNVINEKDSFYYILSIISISLLILSSNSSLLGRLSFYYNCGFMIIVPSATMWHSKKNSKYYSLVKYSIVMMLVLYFCISTPGGTYQIDHYKFFWQQ